MRKGLLSALLATLFALPAGAELCTIDAVPAATLMLPYFEVDLKKRNRAHETLFSINNATPAPTIAHVILWTDLSIPTLAFDVTLTGYDVQEISLLDLFFDGELPSAAANVFGLTNLEDLRDAHTGSSVDGACWAQRLSGNVARGYITIDNAGAETTSTPIFPNDSGYFTSGAVNTTNALWGEYYVFNKKFIQQERLVSIEAGQFPGTTFYGRFSGAGADQREPLATTWGARWFSGTTHLIVWRDSLAAVEPFSCGDPESTGAYPLATSQLVVFDDQEDATEIADELPFAAETQSVKVGSSTLPVFGYRQGWIYLNLNHSGMIAQSFVVVRQDNRKRRSMAMANFFDHAADASLQTGLRAGRGRR